MVNLRGSIRGGHLRGSVCVSVKRTVAGAPAVDSNFVQGEITGAYDGVELSTTMSVLHPHIKLADAHVL